MPPIATSFRLAPLASGFPQEAAAARRLLGAHGLRHTVARATVLAAALRMGRADEVITAQSLHAHLAQAREFVAMATIYRVLTTLQLVGLIVSTAPAQPVEGGDRA